VEVGLFGGRGKVFGRWGITVVVHRLDNGTDNALMAGEVKVFGADVGFVAGNVAEALLTATMVALGGFRRVVVESRSSGPERCRMMHWCRVSHIV
jgi:hypothetical protein